MILTHRFGGPSARLLRDKVEELTGVHYGVTQFPEKITKLHLRFGNYTRLPMETQYNSRDVIMNCTLKKRFSRILTEAGIPTPTYNGVTLPTEDDYPVMVRRTLSGKCGKGIVICPDKTTFNKTWQRGYTWTRFVNCKAEYRAHIFDGEVYRLFKKVYKSGANEPEFPIRNLGYDPNYSNKLRSDYSKFPKLIEDVRLTAKVIGNGFYGLDVGWLEDEKKYFYFEANSAPGLNPNTALELARRLCQAGVF